MFTETSASGAGTWSAPRKALAIFLSVVLVLGLSPFAKIDRAYAGELKGSSVQLLDNTDSSNSTDDSVAKIGETGYASLQDALTAAQDGQTVELLQDVTVEGVGGNEAPVLSVGNGVTLSAGDSKDNAHTITLKYTTTGKAYGISLGDGATLQNVEVLRDGGSALGDSSYHRYYAINIPAGSDNVTLDGVTVNNPFSASESSYRYAVLSESNGSLAIKNSDLASKYVFGFNGAEAGSKVTVSDSTAAAGWAVAAFDGNGYDVSFDHCNLSSTNHYSRVDDNTFAMFWFRGDDGEIGFGSKAGVGNTVNVTNSTVAVTAASTAHQAIAGTAFDGSNYGSESALKARGNKVELGDGNTVTLTDGSGSNTGKALFEYGDTDLEATGGVFNVNPEAGGYYWSAYGNSGKSAAWSKSCAGEGTADYVPAYCTVTEGDGKFTVAADPVATITKDGKIARYASLADAVAAAQAGDTVELLKDTAPASKLTFSKENVVLDLGSNTLTVGIREGITLNGGSLTVQNGEIQGTADDILAVHGGQLDLTGSAEQPLAVNCTSSVIYVTAGKLVLDGAEVASTAGEYTAAYVCGSGASMEIKSGELSSSVASALCVEGNGATATMTGGKIASTANDGARDWTAVYAQYGGKFVMEGGEVSQVSATGNGVGAISRDTSVEISGGKVSAAGKYAAAAYQGGQLTISGGVVENTGSGFGVEAGDVHYNTDGGTVAVSGGKVSAAAGKALSVQSAGGSIAVSGGEFSDDPAQFVAGNAKAVANASDTHPYKVVAAYGVTVSDPGEGGTLNASPKLAAKGEAVKVTAEPAEGYYPKGAAYTVEGGEAQPITIGADGTGTFEMPAAAVTVSAVFAAMGEQRIDGPDSFQAFVGDEPFNLGQSANGELTYASSDDNVVAVSAAGTVTVVGAGTATVTVSAAATATEKAATKDVTVKVDAEVVATIAKDGKTTRYASLADAVAAAQAGDTVELLKDAALSTYLDVNKSITIKKSDDAATNPAISRASGNTVIYVTGNATQLSLEGVGVFTSQDKAYAINFNSEGGKLSLDGCTVRSSGTGNGSCVRAWNYDISLDIKNSTLEAGPAGYGVYYAYSNAGGATLNFEGAAVSGYGAIQMWSTNNVKINAKGTTFTGNNIYTNPASNSFAAISIFDCTNTELNLEGSTVKATSRYTRSQNGALQACVNVSRGSTGAKVVADAASKIECEGEMTCPVLTAYGYGEVGDPYSAFLPADISNLIAIEAGSAEVAAMFSAVPGEGHHLYTEPSTTVDTRTNGSLAFVEQDGKWVCVGISAAVIENSGEYTPYATLQDAARAAYVDEENAQTVELSRNVLQGETLNLSPALSRVSVKWGAFEHDKLVVNVPEGYYLGTAEADGVTTYILNDALVQDAKTAQAAFKVKYEDRALGQVTWDVLFAAMTTYDKVKDRTANADVQELEAYYKGLRSIEVTDNFAQSTIGGTYEGVATDALKNLTGLNRILLSNTGVADKDDLKALDVFAVASGDEGNVTYAPRFPELKTLYLDGNAGIVDVSGLGCYSAALADLKLNGTGVTDVSPLGGLTALTKLDLSGLTGLTTLDGLKGAVSLTDLNVSSSGLTEFDVFFTGGNPTFPNLKTLTATYLNDGDQIKSIDSLYEVAKKGVGTNVKWNFGNSVLDEDYKDCVTGIAAAFAGKSGSTFTAPVVRISKPVSLGSLEFTGETLAGVVWADGYNKFVGLAVAGTTQASAAGQYEASALPRQGYTWHDGTTAAVTYTWWIASNQSPFDVEAASDVIQVARNDADQTIASEKIYNVTTSAAGDVVYEMKDGDQDSFAVDAASGAITVAGGTEVGEYAITVTVTDLGGSGSFSKSVDVPVVVKVVEPAASVTEDETTVSYAAVDEAVAAANDNATITLLQDAEVSDLQLSEAVTFDGKGHTLTVGTAQTSGYTYGITVSANVSLKGLNVVPANAVARGSSLFSAIHLTSAVTEASLEGVNVTIPYGTTSKTNRWALRSDQPAGSRLSLENCTFEAKYCIFMGATGTLESPATVSISGGKMTGCAIADFRGSYNEVAVGGGCEIVASNPFSNINDATNRAAFAFQGNSSNNNGVNNTVGVADAKISVVAAGSLAQAIAGTATNASNSTSINETLLNARGNSVTLKDGCEVNLNATGSGKAVFEYGDTPLTVAGGTFNVNPMFGDYAVSAYPSKTKNYITGNYTGAFTAGGSYEGQADYLGEGSSSLQSADGWIVRNLNDATRAKAAFAAEYDAESAHHVTWNTLFTAMQSYDLVKASADYNSTVRGLKEYYEGITEISLAGEDIETSSYGISSYEGRDAGSLANLTGLRKIDLSNTKIADKDTVAALGVFALQGQDGSYVSRFPNLVELDLSGNASLVDLGGLQATTSLRTLDLSGTGVTSVAPLYELTALTSLDLSGLSGLSDLGGIVKATNLETLNLSGTGMEDLNVLWGGTAARYANLTSLTAQNLTLTSIVGATEVANRGIGANVTWDFTGSKVIEDKGNHLAQIKNGFAQSSASGSTLHSPTVLVSEPQVVEGLVYNGAEQTGFKPAEGYEQAGFVGYTVSGPTKATDAGTYEVTVTLQPDYQWNNESPTLATRDYTWSIAKATDSLQINKTELDLVMGKNESATLSGVVGDLSVEYSDPNPVLAQINGSAVLFIPQAQAVDPVTITIKDSGTENYSPSLVTVKAKVSKAVERPVAETGLVYNGTMQQGVKPMLGAGYTLDGFEATAAGNYTAVAKLDPGYVWADDYSAVDYEMPWSIARARTATPPTAVSGLVYNGASQTGVKGGANVDVKGATSATAVGTYTATATPKENFAWADGTTGAKTITWSIARARTATPPAAVSGLVYNGASQTGVKGGANVDVKGTTSATAVGTYTATATPKAGYAWTDGTFGSKAITWSIAPIPAPQPGAVFNGADAGSGAKADVTVNADGASVTLTKLVSSGNNVTISTITVNGRTLPVTKIAKNALKGSKVKKLTVADSVVEIGASALMNTKKLSTLTIGKGVKKAGKNVLKGSKVKTVTLKSSKLNQTNFKNLFKGSKVKTVKLKGVSKKAKKNYKKWAKKLKVKVK